MQVDKNDPIFMKEYLCYVTKFEEYVYVWQNSVRIAEQKCASLVQERNALFIAVFIPNGIEYPRVAQVQTVLDDLVGVAPVSTVLRVHKVIVAVQTLIGDIPCAGGSRILRPDCMFSVVGRVQ